MPNSASCSSNNFSHLGCTTPATSGHTQVGRMWCSLSAHAHFRTPQTTAITLELLPDLLPQATFCRTSVSHRVPRPIPSGWKGCFSFSKRLSPCSTHHTETGRGCAPSDSFPLSQLSSFSHSPSAHHPSTYPWCLSPKGYLNSCSFCLRSIDTDSPLYLCTTPPFLIFLTTTPSSVQKRCMGNPSAHPSDNGKIMTRKNKTMGVQFFFPSLAPFFF